MPPLALVTGPAGSGKTDALLDRLSARYVADPFAETLVLLPTVRHGDQFRRRLVASCGVAFGLRVATITQLGGDLADGATVAEYDVANELLRRTAADAIEGGGAAYFAPLRESRGLRQLLGVAVSELLAEDVAPDTFAAAARRAGSPALVALSAIYRAYAAGLAADGWTHLAQLSAASARAIADGAAVPPLVVVDGFQFFRGGELALIEALAARVEVVMAFDPAAGGRAGHSFDELLRRFPVVPRVELQAAGAPAPAITAGATADREAQLRAMAREVKQRLTDDATLRPSDCAIAFRQVTPYLGLARQVFAEYDLPLDPAAGEPLSARPLGTWLRRLLHLASGGWRLQDLVAVLGSGFVDRRRWEIDRGDVARFARYGREHHLWAGTDSLARIVDGLRSEATGETTPDAVRERIQRTADGIAAAIAEMRALVEAGEATAAEHARRIDDALFGTRPLVRPDSRRLPGVDVEFDALRGYLRGIASADAAVGARPVTFDAFVARLEEELDAPAVLLREAGGVLLAPMHTLHGLRFAHLAVGGLVEGEFPAPRASTALLDREARATLNDAGLPLPPEPRASEDELWASARSRADATLSLWRSRLDARGRPAAASFYYDSITAGPSIDARQPEPDAAASRREAAIAATQQWSSGGRLRPAGLDAWPVVRQSVAIEQRRRSFGHAGSFEGRLGPNLVPRLVDEAAVWSASRLESYRTCAFQFFGHYALGLRELGEERDTADAATRGTVIHAILQDALAPLVAAGRPLTPDTLPDAVARLRANGPGIWNRAPVEHGFGRAALWRLDAEEVFSQVEALLGRESEASATLGVTHVLGAERQIEAALPLDPPMRIIAGIDRIDLGPELAVVVDYKSGRPIPRSDIESGRRVQLQLYGYVARGSVDASRVVARYAWLRPPDREWDLDTNRSEDAEAIDDVVRVADEVRTAVTSGDFRVDPQVPTCPTYCAFLHVCRVNERSRSKQWS